VATSSPSMNSFNAGVGFDGKGAEKMRLAARWRGVSNEDAYAHRSADHHGRQCSVLAASGGLPEVTFRRMT